MPFANAPSMAPMIEPTITADTMTAIRAIGPVALLREGKVMRSDAKGR